MANTPTIILASRSPRRAALLRDAGYHFVQTDPPFQDPPQPDPQHQDTPQALTQKLADQKARSLINKKDLRIDQGAVILAADTLVVGPDNTLLGQPHDRHDAHRMLTLLIDATHQVHTGVVLLDPATQQSQQFADTAQVQLGHISHSQLITYLDSDQWRSKAGGYNLYDLQAQWPFTVSGDSTTVVGLPMKKLARYIAAWPDAPPELNSTKQTTAGL